MKKITILLILFCATAFAQEGRQNVAVYMAGEEPSGTLGAHKMVGGELVKAISRSGKYSAINRTEEILKVIDKEQGYQRSGAVSDEQIKALGQQFGVQYLCITEISNVKGGSFYFDVRLVDVITAKTINSATATSAMENNNEMMTVAQQVARELIGENDETVNRVDTQQTLSYSSNNSSQMINDDINTDEKRWYALGSRVWCGVGNKGGFGQWYFDVHFNADVGQNGRIDLGVSYGAWWWHGWYTGVIASYEWQYNMTKDGFLGWYTGLGGAIGYGEGIILTESWPAWYNGDESILLSIGGRIGVEFNLIPTILRQNGLSLNIGMYPMLHFPLSEMFKDHPVLVSITVGACVRYHFLKSTQ